MHPKLLEKSLFTSLGSLIQRDQTHRGAPPKESGFSRF